MAANQVPTTLFGGSVQPFKSEIQLSPILNLLYDLPDPPIFVKKQNKAPSSFRFCLSKLVVEMMGSNCFLSRSFHNLEWGYILFFSNFDVKIQLWLPFLINITFSQNLGVLSNFKQGLHFVKSSHLSAEAPQFIMTYTSIEYKQLSFKNKEHRKNFL